MGALCAIADVEALVGAPVPDDRIPGVTRLIELASDIVTDACRPLPATTPGTVTTVTATLVTRQYLNPSMAANESLQGYRVGFSATGLTLTDADRVALGDWAAVATGSGARSVLTPSPFAYGTDADALDAWPFAVVDTPPEPPPPAPFAFVERLDL
jgi:hypothetical protein